MTHPDSASILLLLAPAITKEATEGAMESCAVRSFTFSFAYNF